MGLKETLVGAMLPLSHRDQVLGDLEERGFRARDIVSAVPAAWIAYFYRDWIAPVPNLAAASDDALRLRLEQLRRGSVTAVALPAALVWTYFGLLTEPAGFSRWTMFLPLVSVWLMRLVWDGPPTLLSLQPTRGMLVEEYRAALTRMIGGGLFMLVSVPPLLGRLLRREPVPVDAVIFLCVCTAVFLVRWRRAKLELANLSRPTSTAL